MINTLHVKGYRGFENFHLENLSKINLLVGTNNSGKTSLLEAISLLSSGPQPTALWQSLTRRGERFNDGDEVELCHLFRNHQIYPGSRFIIEATASSLNCGVAYSIEEAGQEDGLFDEDIIGSEPRLGLRIDSFPGEGHTAIKLTSNAGLSARILQGTGKNLQVPGIDAQFVATESLNISRLHNLWNGIMLTPDEDRVIRALQILEPNIERVAAIITDRHYVGRTRGGFVVKANNMDMPVPIGSFGDGIWRMLALAIALIRAKDGILLVDEIDTGLHYSVMEDMWRLIVRTAIELNVQVFATTHSLDCVTALAQIGRKDGTDITVQRIERNSDSSVGFSESELKAVTSRDIEVR